MTKQQALEHLIHCAKVVVLEYRREFEAGELEDVDALDAAIAAYESAAEPPAPREPCPDCTPETCLCGGKEVP